MQETWILTLISQVQYVYDKSLKKQMCLCLLNTVNSLLNSFQLPMEFYTNSQTSLRYIANKSLIFSH